VKIPSVISVVLVLVLVFAVTVGLTIVRLVSLEII
jgi:hypothetical protein